MTKLTIGLRTLTPLWTGGAEARCDRVHETGILGGLRWWYEAIVRGLGGYACDPASDDDKARQARCLFDAKAYGTVWKETNDPQSAVNAGLEGAVCPACYLFGCTGWRRLFRLEAGPLDTKPLYLLSTVAANKSWFNRIYDTKTGPHQVFYDSQPQPALALLPRGFDADYVQSQLALILRFVDMYAGLGAKLQHGFGQIAIDLPPMLASTTFEAGLQALRAALDARPFRGAEPTVSLPSLDHFFLLDYELDRKALSHFIGAKHSIGESTLDPQNPEYVPIAFDLRTKGDWESRTVGLRRWLEEDPAADNPRWPHDLLCQVMGASAQGGGKLTEEERQGSRIFVSMPYGDGETYRLRWFGFVPPGQDLSDDEPLTVESLIDEIQAYMDQLFEDATLTRTETGSGMLEGGAG